MPNRISLTLRLLPAAFATLAIAAEHPPLTQAEMQQVLHTLQSQFAMRDAVDFTALNRAAIEGLLRQNPDTIQILTLPDIVPATAPPLCETLAPGIACLRPAALGKKDAGPVREILTKLAAGATATLILDLRAAADDDDPRAAVDFAEMFVAKDTPLFSFPDPLKTAAEPAWTRELTVLIDGETGNVAEILAAILKSKNRAVLIGAATRGRTAAIGTLPLRKVAGGNLVLRFTGQRVIFADGNDPFGKGIVPDIVVPMEVAARRAVFELQAKAGLARSIFETARPRTNENALVTRINPELPERIARTAGLPARKDGPLIDRPLQLAVDILTARQVLASPDGR